MTEWSFCPHCGLKHRKREDRVCPRCGQDASTTPMPDAARVEEAIVSGSAPSGPAYPDERPGPSAPAQVLIGVIVAGALGAGWALMVQLSGDAQGWFAWALGALVGAAVGYAGRRNYAFAPWAALIATCVGLLVGKMLILQWGTASVISNMVVQDRTELARAFMVKMTADDPDHTIPLELASYDELFQVIERAQIPDLEKKATELMARSETETRQNIAKWYGAFLARKMSTRDRAPFTLSAWDFLWSALGLFAAWWTAYRVRHRGGLT